MELCGFLDASFCAIVVYATFRSRSRCSFIACTDITFGRWLLVLISTVSRLLEH